MQIGANTIINPFDFDDLESIQYFLQAMLSLSKKSSRRKRKRSKRSRRRRNRLNAFVNNKEVDELEIKDEEISSSKSNISSNPSIGPYRPFLHLSKSTNLIDVSRQCVNSDFQIDLSKELPLNIFQSKGKSNEVSIEETNDEKNFRLTKKPTSSISEDHQQLQFDNFSVSQLHEITSELSSLLSASENVFKEQEKSDICHTNHPPLCSSSHKSSVGDYLNDSEENMKRKHDHVLFESLDDIDDVNDVEEISDIENQDDIDAIDDLKKTGDEGDESHSIRFHFKTFEELYQKTLNLSLVREENVFERQMNKITRGEEEEEEKKKDDDNCDGESKLVSKNQFLVKRDYPKCNSEEIKLAGKKKTKITERKPWTAKEDEALIQGIKRYGCHWAEIVKKSGFHWNRTNVQLKDRWRIIKKWKKIE